MRGYTSLKSARKSIIIQVAALSAVALIICLAAWLLTRHHVTTDILIVHNRDDLQTSDLVISWDGDPIPVSDYRVFHMTHDDIDSAYLHITFMPEKPGEYILTVRDTDGEDLMFDRITVTRLMVSFFWTMGDFTASSVVTASVLAWMTGLFFIMLLAFFRLKGPLENSSEAIFTCGAAIFLGLLLCFSVLYYVRYLLDPLDYPMWSFVLDIAGAGRRIFSLTRIGLLIISVLLIVSNIALLRHENPRFQNVLGILLGFLIIGLCVSGAVLNQLLSELFLKWLVMFGNMTGIAFTYGECIMISTVICGLRAARHVPATDRDYILILGCGFRKDGSLSPLLKGRVDKALDFWRRQKEETGKAAIIIPSGGQGSDEPMAEATAMYNYIRGTDVPAEYVIPEDRSVNTYQNMKFCRDIIDGRTPDASAARVCYVTTNYHVFRSGILANRVGLTGEGLGAKTRWWFWPNAYIRECVGFFANRKLMVLYLAVLAFYAFSVIQLTNIMY